MPEEINSMQVNQVLLAQKTITSPAIVGWNRLEPRPRSNDFERSLKAEVRDALWMLSRQWQMGEFEGEDNGSPVNVRLLTGENKINRYASLSNDATELDDSIPLQARVERETIPDSLQLKIQFSTQFFKLLKREVLSQDYTLKLKEKYKIELPAEIEQKNKVLCNQESSQLYNQASLRSIDGYLLLRQIFSGDYDNWINSFSDTDMNSADKSALISVGKQLLAWFKRLYSESELENETSWSAPYLEYQFSCSAKATTDTQTILSADQYTSGHLDWYSFNIDKTKSVLDDKEGQIIAELNETEKLLSVIPTPITFGGMPNARYWEMEDSKTDFGAIDANTTDIAKLIVTEFGLIYSNDWFVIPYQMDTGTLCEIKGFIVTDTFGDNTLIQAAGMGSDHDWQNWSLYSNSVNGSEDVDHKLLMASSTLKVMESDPVERINFIRDEMANMVWGVENIVTLPSGKPRDGQEAAKELSAYLSKNYTTSETSLANLKYSLGTTVPENWIPFISVNVSDSSRKTQMQRSAMPRTTDGTNALIEPRTSVLFGPDPFYIHEEEVPRSGTIITKTFQRTRWYNGKTVLWLGRKVTNGKGEGNSGLKFDQANAKSN